MKTLLLLRHAKSIPNDSHLRDLDRPLDRDGLKQATAIGLELSTKGFEPDLILSSPAKRARKTTELVRDAAHFTVTPSFDDDIYEASAGTLLEVVHRVKRSAEVVLLIGHNPGLEQLVAVLSGQSCHLGTATLVSIQLNVEAWSEVRPGGGEIELIAEATLEKLT